VKERKDRVDDALHATRAAVEEGIVPGGGTALLYATKALEGLKGATTTRPAASTSSARRSRPRSARSPRTPAMTAPSLRATCCAKVTRTGLQRRDRRLREPEAAGVIDPTKVVRTALQDAASVAGLLITTEAAIMAMLPEDKPAHGTRDRHARRHGRHGRHGLLSPGSGNWQADAQGVPYLADAQAAIICHQRQRISYGSHDIFIGDVQAVRLADSADPLVYFDGAYRRIGDKL
jgi:hypothetical protein